MTIRIAHSADWHVGVDNYSAINPETGLSYCVEDFQRAIMEFVTYCVNNRVDVAVIAGDLYKSRDPNQTHMSIVAHAIRELAKAGIIVLIVAGNHDLPGNRYRKSTVNIFSALEVPGVEIFEEPEVIDLQIRDEILQVAALPWVRRSDLWQHEKMSVDEVKQAMLQKYLDDLRDMTALIHPDQPSILIGHCSVTTSTFGSEAAMSLSPEPLVPAEVLAQGPWQAVMLGHIHKAQFIPTSQKVAYAGSIQRLDFGAEGQDKGFWLWQIERGGMGTEGVKEWIPVSAREFLTLDIHRMVLKPPPDVRNKIVRIQAVLPEEHADIFDETHIRELCKDASWVVINKKVIREESRQIEDTAPMAEMTPIEALRKYCEIREKTPERTEVLVEAAMRMME